MIIFNEDECMNCNPFEGDFGSTEDRILKDKIVTARKERECTLCGEMILPKSRIRTRSEISDGELMYFSWCSNCCRAMANSGYDDGVEFEYRYSLRN